MTNYHLSTISRLRDGTKGATLLSRPNPNKPKERAPSVSSAFQIDWTLERQEFLYLCWQSGMPTKTIAQTCAEAWNIVVTKNAVIGEAGRLRQRQPGLWNIRLSPIQRKPPRPQSLPNILTISKPPAPQKPPALPKVSKPKAPPPIQVIEEPSLPPPRPISELVSAFRAHVAAKQVIIQDEPEVRTTRLMCEARILDPTRPLRRSDNSGCRWPIGEPRDRKNFRFCDAGLYDVAEPYCIEHKRIGTTRRWNDEGSYTRNEPATAD